MPLTFYRCLKRKREFDNERDAHNCEAAHPEPVAVRNIQYTIKRWPYSVEVTFNDGSKRVYNADDIGG